MTDREHVVNVIMQSTLDSMNNTLSLLEAIEKRSGRRAAERWVDGYCRDRRLPTMEYAEFLSCIKSAITRKLIITDERSEIGDILYGGRNG